MEFFECKYCNKILRSEKAFINHYCEDMKRHELLSTVTGQLAFEIYSRWSYILKGRKASRDIFKKSRYFTSFIKFAKYYKRINGLSDLDEFLLYMIKKQFSPSQWLDPRVIQSYLDAMDCINPKGKIERSVEFILKLSDKCECDTSEIFDYLNANIISDCIRMHKLSPWLLLNSKKFKIWLNNSDTLDQDLILEYINLDSWIDLIKENEKYSKLSKKYCKALGI